MIKKIFFLALCCAFGIQKNALAMEQSSEPMQNASKERINVTDSVSDDILILILGFTTGAEPISDANIIFNKTKTKCLFFAPRTILDLNTHKVNLSSGSLKSHWVPSINFNPATLIFENERSTRCLFSVQCWYENYTHYTADTYYETEYRIDNDEQKQRFFALGFHELEEPLFFDGPNEDELVLIGGNVKNEKNGKTIDIGTIQKKTGLFKRVKKAWSVGKKEKKQFEVEKKGPFYQYYIGKFTTQCAELYAQNIYYNKYENEFGFTSPLTAGTLTALALYKKRTCNPEDPTDNKNRFALADDAGISVYEINETIEQDEKCQKEQKSKISLQKIGFGCSRYKKDFDTISVVLKNLSFLTAETLLGLSVSGTLLSVAFDKKWGTVCLHPQRIKNKAGENIIVHAFAVNSLDPHKVIVYTEEGLLIYLDLKNWREKRAHFLMKTTTNHTTLWYSGTNLSFGSYNHFEKNYTTENYRVVDEIDLTLEKKEKHTYIA